MTRAKALRRMHFTKEFLQDFGQQRNLTDEQQIVEAVGKFMYADNFIRAVKQTPNILQPRITPKAFDCTYLLVFWAERET